jgi:hypothetical protein
MSTFERVEIADGRAVLYLDGWLVVREEAA